MNVDLTVFVILFLVGFVSTFFGLFLLHPSLPFLFLKPKNS